MIQLSILGVIALAFLASLMFLPVSGVYAIPVLIVVAIAAAIVLVPWSSASRRHDVRAGDEQTDYHDTNDTNRAH